MKTAGIIGAGTMGSGIAQVAAAAGWDVLLFDNQAGMAAKAIEKTAASLRSLAEKGKITAEELKKQWAEKVIAKEVWTTIRYHSFRRRHGYQR